jgi:AraC family L-rhamnose operon transcriptional activator RhaR
VRSIQRREVFRPGTLPIAANEVPALTGIPEHTHEFLEMAIVSRGRGLNVTRGRVTPIEVGSVILIRPGVWHAYREPEDLWTFNLYLAPELLQRELSWVVEYPQLSHALLRGDENLGVLSPEETAMGVGWLGQIRDLPAGTHAPRMTGLVNCVLDLIWSSAATNGGALDSTIAKTVVSMMNTMQGDLARKWSIEDLASGINASPAVVHRQFKAHVGMSPMAWLHQARGEAVAAELILSGRPVAEIGRLVGWPDPNYLSRRFRSLFGMSPTEYRRRFASGNTMPVPH